MLQKTAVVLDKDPGKRDEIRYRLSRCGVLPICFEDEWICLENVHHIKPSFALLRTDSYERAFRFVNIARAIKNDFPIVVLSDRKKIECLIRNNWLANLFFLQFSVDKKKIQGTINSLAQLKMEDNKPVLIAASPERKRLMQKLPLLGLAREPILIQGKQGTGKKQIAKSIHGFSPAKDAILEFVDAQDITEQWIRETGAFIKSADKGGNKSKIRIIKNLEKLPYTLQSQLLLVLDEVNGNNRNRNRDHSSTPFISLADGELDILVQNGTFRKDLYHRLSVLKINVPPLAGHSNDIRALAEFFAAQYGIQHNGGICRLSDSVLDDLIEYPWPGNITELKRSVEKAIANPYENGVVDLSAECRRGVNGKERQMVDAWIDADDIRNYLHDNADISLKKARTRYVARIEKKIMKAALAYTKGNCKKAAVLLNISYKSMLNRVKEYRLV